MYKYLSWAVALIAIGYGALITYNLHKVPEMPKFDYEQWWGKGPQDTKQDTTIRTFTIDFNDTVGE